MKTKILPLLALLFMLSGTATAQKGINYKALIKDNSGNVVANQNITIEFSILEGPEIGFLDPVYIEAHTVTTDVNGIVIANIGEGTPEAGYEDVYGDINWGSFFGSHFLKVQIDTGSGLTDMGTTEFKAVPYALYAESSNNSGLEAINEGNGTGRRLIGMNPENYGPIANFAVDLSYSPASSTTRGATGDYAAALGYQTTASGYSSFASGVNTMATGTQATAMGAGTVASGNSSTALGIGTRAEAPNTTAIGLFNVGGGDPLQASTTDPLFEIGNGQYVDGINDVRTNALTVLRNGNATLAGTLTQNSDRRLKNNIEDLPYGLNEILELAPVSYNWKRYPEKGKSLGLIAQEVQPIINEIVHEAEDKGKTLSVSYIELVPVLIKAIQEQQAIIDQQAQTIQNQETASAEQSQVLQGLLKRVEALEKQQFNSTPVELVKN
ncbi:hypothetical protein IA57_11125 [Mangrovimonas yunxiaonensis]|uniref:Peptidase S74 domain-containing protein n=1 Tax=Mangrovimonas yunxiaonensis TaxID=1197477 RepID=A0A084TJU4_9FLAO|nr:tail fiber domain-containing protein [Mangrovimonas yunxiaonensis]KFB00980.1 hypothetical protein IA57_11125 [Mangrovimonas yunxiaonensis]GGH43225.1 hypothetical protein GCM10011364_15270 [Mangrovimonas yunxiaonensis]